VFHSCQPAAIKTIEQPRVGAIDFNQKDVALIGTLLPSMNGLALPFLFRSFEHVQNVPDERTSGNIPKIDRIGKVE
jgi:TRAP-type C4-dicarboxylate transport system substrate-binding protein